MISSGTWIKGMNLLNTPSSQLFYKIFLDRIIIYLILLFTSLVLLISTISNEISQAPNLKDCEMAQTIISSHLQCDMNPSVALAAAFIIGDRSMPINDPI